MPTPEQIAAALRNQPDGIWQGETLGQRTQSLFGLDPNIDRPTGILPTPDIVNGKKDWTSWTAPEWFAGLGTAIATPAYAASGNEITPAQAVNFATNVMGGGLGTSRMMTAPTGVGGKDLAMNAYHGTPHEIKGGFDLAKVGTGEGAQSYGHGIYFAEHPDVAKSYQTKLSQRPDIAVFRADDGFYVKKGLGSDGQNIAGPFKTGAEAEQIRKGLPENQGNLYKVDIPDAAIPNMLDWDKPLSQQQHIWDKLPQDVRNSIDDALENSGRTSMSDALGDYKGRHLYKALEHHEVHESLPPQIGASDWFTGNTSPSQHTSAFLNSIGVTGVKYLDQGSRTAAKGTNNYVVFDPTTVKILEQNNKPVDRKELIKEQIDKLTE